MGFVDLGGFSERVETYSPQEISTYLQPFLCGAISATTTADGLIDKTIGDEVMLFLPEFEDDGGLAAVFNLNYLLSLLDDLQTKLGSEYPFRMGFAYGRLYIDRIKGEKYSEWTLAGRSVILAKRLVSLLEVKAGCHFSGALGVLCDETPEKEFHSILQFIASGVSSFDHQILDHPHLKGISSAHCATFGRKPGFPPP